MRHRLLSSAQETTNLLTQFFDGSTSDTQAFAPPSDDSFTSGFTPGLDLAEWFRRPVKIKSYQWSENSRLCDEFNPWRLYFNHAEIKAKLKGYSRLQATLHIKLVINASPYHYSAGYMSYLPLANDDRTTAPVAADGPAADSRFSGGLEDPLLSGMYSPWTGGTKPGNLIVNTCRPCANFYPQTNQGCEMVLPFCYYKNWINLDSDLSELKYMGRVRLYTPFELESAAAASVNPVSVTIYAWCEDHKVAGPSYVMQGGDEYQARPVSTAMSVASSIAKSLSSVPRLGPYAMATSTALSAMGAAARWFGYSNPPVIDDVHAMVPNYMSNYASPEISVAIDKLALDPKNEVTVDSRTVGLDGVDHMAMSHILSKKVAFDSAFWAATAAPETLLWMQHVTPMVFTCQPYEAAVTLLTANAIQMTPSCQLGGLFDFWAGTIAYEFQAIASQFHRGRLLLTYDPDGILDGYSKDCYTSPRTISKIWDISENPTFRFEVPWMASTSMLRTGGLRYVCAYADDGYGPTGNDNTVFTTTESSTLTLPGSWGYLNSAHNGTITISVLNSLTSSLTTASINIIGTMDCSNVEFFSPRDITVPLSFYRMQSEDDQLAASPADVTVAAAPPTYEPPTKHVVYVGEIVRSIRTLMHRANFLSSHCVVNSGQVINANAATGAPSVDWAAYPTTLGYIYTMASSLVLPMLPYTPGTITSVAAVGGAGSFLTGYGNMYNDNHAAAKTLVEVDLKPPCMTAYFYPSYVGWRGSSTFHARANDYKTTGTGTTATVWRSMSIGRSSKAIFNYVVGWSANANYWFKDNPIITRMVTSTTLNNSFAASNRAQQIIADRCKVPAQFTTGGAAGMAQTNPDKVDVVNANIPYYSNYRMLPCNPNANWNLTLSDSRVNWLDTDADYDGYKIQNVEIVNCMEFDSTETVAAGLIRRMPTFDVFHRAGPDFTLFWYLNPAPIHVYAGVDSYPEAWD